MLTKYKSLNYNHLAIIILASFILILPQIISGNMILGSDSIFHFNRFYDTSQQIKNNNFSYFISLYGFQQTGRIITPLYSPLFSYFFGILLLVCGSWYKFQIVSNFLLFLSAGLFMYRLLGKMKIHNSIALKICLIYMTTYSVSYWVIRQGYSSWGAALLPLCMIPLIDLICEKKYNIIKVAFSIAIMFQLHFISTIFLIFFYLFAFIYCFFSIENKLKLIINLIISVLLFFILTFNIWFALIDVYFFNKIIPPFINKDIFENTITGTSSYWLVNPILLIFIILLVIISIKYYKKMTILNKFFLITGLVFFIMSSNLFPWRLLYKHNVQWINLFQFPFRFFVPATICFLCSFSLSISEKLLKFKWSFLNKLTVVLCFLQSLFLYTLTLSEWNKNDSSFINAGNHLFITSDNYRQVKQSFYSKDLSKSLDLVVKSTPDYLPLYTDTKENKYGLYEKYVLFNDVPFKKTVKSNKLLVEWNNSIEEKIEITLPVVKYENTTLIFNGKELENVRLTPIGNPILESSFGKNSLELFYK